MNKLMPTVLAVCAAMTALAAQAGDFPSGYSKCANQGGTCTVKNAPNLVAYGVSNKWVYKYVTTSTVTCDTATFGSDPYPNKSKKCSYNTNTQLTGTVTTTPIPSKTATVTPTVTKAATAAPTATKAATATPTTTKTATATPTATKQATPTATKVATATPTPTKTATATPTATATSTASSIRYRGVSLAGAEFGADTWGGGTFPGTSGTNYIYPTTSEVDYFVGKGMNTLRLPFRWERLQQSLGATFDSAEQARMDTVVNYATTTKGAYIVLDPHNYARYNGKVIGSSITNAQFADFWSKLASHYKGNSKVIFSLMNEPHDMDTALWVSAANAAIGAIRTAGASNLILVPGNSWTGAHSWISSGNGTAMLGIVDSGNNYAFEVHQYLDSDSSGTSETCVSSTIGSERLATFTQWLKTNGKKGFLGELGGARNSTCYAAIDDQLTHVDNNSSVWVGWTWWAAGPWWGEYMFTLEPSGSTDRPQLAYLLKHIK